MMKEDNFINFSGITHDHATLCNNTLTQQNQTNQNNTNQQMSHINQDHDSSCSTIAIMRRHPMYDSLILVKKYRTCLRGFSLEFPADNIRDSGDKLEQQAIDGSPSMVSSFCSRGRLVSRFLDGDDPIYKQPNTDKTKDQAEPRTGSNTEYTILQPFVTQLDDKGDLCELVHVPINGLMDRLKNYTENGIAVDSRVYAFAMGLKTAERILTTNAMKEVQETPI